MFVGYGVDHASDVYRFLNPNTKQIIKLRDAIWPIKTPMSEGYHPGVDDTPLCTEEDSAKYRSIVGCCIWRIV
jgi:hypothetical protein